MGFADRARFSQEKIVLIIAAAMFVLFSILLDGFLTAGNIVSLVQNVSILGVLGVGMALTIIGRGIDLSMVANMAISVAWVLFLANGGTPLPLAILCGLAFCLAVGLINGILIAYVEIPAIFATLAMGTAVCRARKAGSRQSVVRRSGASRARCCGWRGSRSRRAPS